MQKIQQIFPFSSTTFYHTMIDNYCPPEVKSKKIVEIFPGTVFLRFGNRIILLQKKYFRENMDKKTHHLCGSNRGGVSFFARSILKNPLQ